MGSDARQAASHADIARNCQISDSCSAEDFPTILAVYDAFAMGER
jgi:hypothetical protein